MDLDEEIRQRNRRYLLLALILLACGYVALASYLGLVLATVWTSPVFGSLLAYWLVQHWAGKSFRWFRKRAYAGTDGIYHAYDDLQVRVRWNGAFCEVAMVDVLNVLRIPKDEQRKIIRRLALRYPGDVYQCAQKEWWFADTALLDWLADKGQNLHHHVLRFRRWFERETFPALRRKAELGKVPDGNR
ncbi:hypothetical protein HYN24_06880 [Dechloromonas sp. HYN0024]|nr:hypothetical protein HYN24_06880 [Dechloromonas sp. HYN0024]